MSVLRAAPPDLDVFTLHNAGETTEERFELRWNKVAIRDDAGIESGVYFATNKLWNGA